MYDRYGWERRVVAVNWRKLESKREGGIKGRR
jgi:hypothetical protein